jgi:hypothetical protein
LGFRKDRIVNARIEPLTEATRDRIREQVDEARRFVAAHLPGEGEEAFSLLLLDEAFAEWVSAGQAEAEAIDATVEVVGAAFGEFLVRGLGFSWVFVHDEEGTDMAVHGLPGEGDVLVYPQRLVAKRWQRREAGFLIRTYGQIAAHVKTLRKGKKS